MTRHFRSARRGSKLVAGVTTGALAFAPALISSSAGAVTGSRYVASTGSDTGNCSVQTSPCATIAYAISKSNAGDTVDVLDQLGGGTGDSEDLTVPHDLTLEFQTFEVLSGNIDIQAGGTLTFEEASASQKSVELQGVVSGAGNLVQDTADGQILLQDHPETYTGSTSVLAGTLNVSGASGLGHETAVDVAQGADVFLAGSNEIASLDGAGSVCIAAGTLTIDSTGLSPFSGVVNDAQCGGSGTVAMSTAPALLLGRQPVSQLASGGDATLQAMAVGNPAPTFQWQVSTDHGATWSDVTDGADVSGSTTDTLSLSSLTAAESGNEYRAVITASSLQVTTEVAQVWVTDLVSGPLPLVQNPPAGLWMNPVFSFECTADFPDVRPRTAGCTGTYTDPSGATYTLDMTGMNPGDYAVAGYAVDPATITPAAPDGQSYVAAFAVAVCSLGDQVCMPGVPSGGTLTLTISNPEIQGQGDTLFELPAPSGGSPTVKWGSGTATISFVDDPVFAIAQPAANPVVLPPVVTGGSSAPSQAPKLIRLGGSDRIATAVTISQYDFPNAATAKAVVVGRDDLFADDLAGSPFAASVGGPLLLTDPTYLDNRTLVEINRVLPAGGTVYLLGDTSALSAPVEQAVAAAGYHVVRVGGPDRWATAVDVAQAMGNPTTVFEADGTSTGGAVSASPAAILTHGAILLTAGSTQSPITGTWLTAHSPATGYTIGQAAATADPAATAIAGADNDATSVAVAQRFFPKPTVVGIATDGVFPDALTGASTSEAGNGPTFLVPTNGPLPAAVAAYLKANPTITTVIVYGGTAAVSDSVAQEAIQAVG